MKIVDILTKKMSYKMRKMYKVAYEESMYSHGVYVKILTDSGLCGLGEAVPIAFVTGETVGSILAAVELMKPVLIGANPEDIANIHKIMDGLILGNTAAKAAIDIACYDVCAKAKNISVHKMIGANIDKFVTDVTIGIDTVQNMVDDAVFRVNQGFRVLKVKGGIKPEDDFASIKAIRNAVGESVELRMDFNQGYDYETAVYVLNKLPELGVTEAEQPLPSYDIENMARLKKVSPVPILADESVHSPRDAQLLCEKDACDVLNIKLMKCGGIYPALQINSIAEKYGKNCIVGCMTESKLGIAAGAAVVAASNGRMGIVDLDSFLLFADTEAGVSGGFKVNRDEITLSEQSGFGFDEYEL